MNLWIVLGFLSFGVAVAKVCPGGSFKCPDSATCCELLDKSYGCCPLVDAVCCDDHIHCCPANTKCSAGMCVQSMNTTDKLQKTQSHSVVCPGGNFVCPDGSSCCLDPVLGVHSCCALENAVCCGGFCCPFGTSCDQVSQRCIGKGFIHQAYDLHKPTLKPTAQDVAAYSRIISSSKHVSSVVCPGSTFQCPDKSTCCKMQSGDWGCCPFENAVCCNDGMHCCPNGLKCDPTSQFCVQGLANITSTPKRPAQRIAGSVNTVCPDKKQSCSKFQTCCKISEVDYGCCQYQNATCCSDFAHCCPEHMDCDVKFKKCIPRSDSNHLNNYIVNLI